MSDMNDSFENTTENVVSDTQTSEVREFEEQSSEVFEEQENLQCSEEITERLEPKKKRKTPFAIITDCFLVLLTLTLIALIVANLFFFQGYSVVGVSMKNTYQSGDKITVCKWKDAERGDVVVIDRGEKFVIKRVIAFGGETVKIDTKGQVYINGEPLDEPYLDPNLIPKTMNDYECYVPEGMIFYLGDNRKESEDSRNDKIGPVEEETIIGVVSEFFTKIKDKPIYKNFLYYVFS